MVLQLFLSVGPVHRSLRKYSILLQGALNLYSQEELYNFFLKKPIVPLDTQKRIIIVFHCEFSSERGPRMWVSTHGRVGDGNGSWVGTYSQGTFPDQFRQRLNQWILSTEVWRMLGRWRKGVSTIQRLEAVKEKGLGIRYQWSKGERVVLLGPCFAKIDLEFLLSVSKSLFFLPFPSE